MHNVQHNRHPIQPDKQPLTDKTYDTKTVKKKFEQNKNFQI